MSNPTLNKIKEWRKNPLRFAVDNFDFEPDKWQEKALIALGENNTGMYRLCLKACTGPGKSALLAIIGWWRLACFCEKDSSGHFEHPKGAALSITKENLSDNLWAELSKWQSRSPFLSAAFTWTKTRIYANDHPETWFLAARSFAKDADQEAIGRSLSGLHGKFPFILLDETGDMPTAVIKAAEQIFTGSPTSVLIAQAGNPTSTSGLLYHTCKKLRDDWEIVTITSDPEDPDRTPRVTVEHAQKMINRYGRENPWVMATILGMFPPGGFNNLLSLEEVEAAMKRSYLPEHYRHAAKIVGVDVARYGDDATQIARRQGLQAFPFKDLRNASVTDVAGWTSQIGDDWKADGTIIDTTGGLGAGVLDIMGSANRTVFACEFAGKALDPQYANKRTEIICELAEWVKEGGALPEDQELLEELTEVKYGYKRDQKIIEPKDDMKDRLGRSPDKMDALAVTFSEPIQPKEKHPIVHGRQHTAQIEEWNPYDY